MLLVQDIGYRTDTKPPLYSVVKEWFQTNPSQHTSRFEFFCFGVVEYQVAVAIGVLAVVHEDETKEKGTGIIIITAKPVGTGNPCKRKSAVYLSPPS